MEFLTLNNGIQMPLVGLGTFMLGGEICNEAVATAIQSGLSDDRYSGSLRQRKGSGRRDQKH
mgnify:CR=1 FL=1